MIEQIASRQEYATCESVLRLADDLYLNESSEDLELKVGVTNHMRDGNVRRFIAFLQQIGATYDVHGAPVSTLRGLLPSEFDGWASPSST